MYTKNSIPSHLETKEKHFAYTRKKLAYTEMEGILLDNIKAISGRNPFRVIKSLPLF